MGSREALAGAVFGAFAMIAVSVDFAWLTTGPDHEDWSHTAIAMSPFAALFGAAAGAVCGLLIRFTRPRSTQSSNNDRRNKRKQR